MNSKRPTIGLHISGIESFYTSRLWPSVAEVAREHDYNLVIFSAGSPFVSYNYGYQHNVVHDFIHPGNLDALILSTGSLSIFMKGKELQNLSSLWASMPIVSIAVPIPGVPSVTLDNKSGIIEAVEHLYKKHDRRRIAFIRGPEANAEANDRFEAYQEGLRRVGLEFDPQIVAPGDFFLESGRKAIAELVDVRKEKFDSVIAANDYMALDAMEALKSRGFQIPREISVAGFDNIDEGLYRDIPLTTIDQPIQKMAYQAGLMAVDLIQGKRVPDENVFQTRFIPRSSCGCKQDQNALSSFVFINSTNHIPQTTAHTKLSKDLTDTIFHKLSGAILKTVDKDYLISMTADLTALKFEEVEALRLVRAFRDFVFKELDSGRSILIWQEILSALGEEINLFYQTIKEGNPYKSILQCLQDTLTECIQVELARSRQNYSDTMFRVRYVMRDLATSLQMDEIQEVLTRHIATMGIRSCYLTLYDDSVIHLPGQDWHMPESSEMVYWSDDKGQHSIPSDSKRFLSRRILPEAVLPNDRRYTILIKSLYFREEQFGFIIFEMTCRQAFVYETLRMQVSSAIKSTRITKARENAEKKLIEANLRLVDSNEKLTELDRAKTSFFANISHELRTPITLLLGPLECIVAGDYGQSVSRENPLFNSMLNNSLRLLKLINNLLDFSRIEAGRMDVRRRKTDIVKLIRFYIENVHSAAISRGINISFLDRSGGLIAYIDRDLLEKAVFNLLSNAMKFTDVGGSITIELDMLTSQVPQGEQQMFTLKVRDTGIGIQEDMQDKVFERFTQLDTSASRKYEGTGIGLAFVKEIVELLGGSVSLKSKVGEGSEFSLQLPVGTPVDDIESREDEPFEILPYLIADMTVNNGDELKNIESFSDRQKVLVIDDNADMGRFIASILKAEYEVLLASDGLQGLKIAREKRPDIIVSDVMMPGMDGTELTKVLKDSEDLRGIPVILLTARADIAAKLKGLEIGADDYLSKPFNARELRARIRSHLEMKSLRDRVEDQRNILEEKKNLLEDLVREQTRTIELERDNADALRRKAEKQLEDFLLVLAAAIERKDKYTGGHVGRVARYARDIGSKLKLSDQEIHNIYLGAIVHDVGKIGVKDSLLNKPGKLSESEMLEMKEHPDIGRTLLSSIENIDTAVMIAYCHQERWDGSGYPRGLRGEEIPLPARIVTIADYWDSIITERPYRRAMGLQEAMDVMAGERGRAFDPELFDLFFNPKDHIYLNYLVLDQK